MQIEYLISCATIQTFEPYIFKFIPFIPSENNVQQIQVIYVEFMCKNTF